MAAERGNDGGGLSYARKTLLEQRTPRLSRLGAESGFPAQLNGTHIS